MHWRLPMRIHRLEQELMHPRREQMRNTFRIIALLFDATLAPGTFLSTALPWYGLLLEGGENGHCSVVSSLRLEAALPFGRSFSLHHGCESLCECVRGCLLAMYEGRADARQADLRLVSCIGRV